MISLLLLCIATVVFLTMHLKNWICDNNKTLRYSVRALPRYTQVAPCTAVILLRYNRLSLNARRFLVCQSLISFFN